MRRRRRRRCTEGVAIGRKSVRYVGARLWMALSVEEDFKLNREMNQEPMELVKDRGGVVSGGCSRDETCC